MVHRSSNKKESSLLPACVSNIEYRISNIELHQSEIRFSFMSSSDSLLVEYQDACVYRSDLALLESNTAWLNDACLHFQMTRLQQRTQPPPPPSAAAAKDGLMPRIVCIDPSVVSFFMHQLSFQDKDDIDEMKTLCQSWGLPLLQQDREIANNETPVLLLLLPINDNHGASSLSFQTPGSGTHWSLLVCAIYVPQQGQDHDENDKGCVFFHFDSSKGYNAPTAKRVANKLKKMYLIYQQEEVQGESASSSEDMAMNGATSSMLHDHVFECQTPQQTNGYDCGVCTLCNAQAIINTCACQNDNDDWWARITCTRSRFLLQSDSFKEKEASYKKESEDSSSITTHTSFVLDFKQMLEGAVLEFSKRFGGTNAMCNSTRQSIASDIRSLHISSEG